MRSFVSSLLPFLEKLPENFHIFISIPRIESSDRFLNHASSIDTLLSISRIKSVLIDCDECPEEYRDISQREKNTVMQWLRIKKMFSIIPKHYDIVVRCRPDVKFLCDTNTFLAYFNSVTNTGAHKILIPSGFDIFDSRYADERFGYTNDQIAIGSRQAMSVYCSMYDYLFAHKQTKPLVSEQCLYRHLAENDISVQRIDLPYNLVLSECFTFSICGDSGSGKSYVSKLIQQILPFDNTLLFETDRYHKWERGSEEYKTFTHLHPEANHLEKLSTDAYKLRLGEDVYIVDYDHDTGKFTEPQHVQAKNYIIFCGLHTLYRDSLRNIMDLRIYLDTDPALKTAWKVERDVRERGAAPEKVLATMKAREPDFKQFIQPQRDNANIVICKKADGRLEITLCRKSFALEIRYLRTRVQNLATEVREDERFVVFVFGQHFTSSKDLTELARNEGYALATDLKDSHDGIIQYLFILLAWKKPYEPIFA